MANELKSEILFNRALLWLLLANITMLRGDNMAVAILYIVCGVLNIVRSAVLAIQDK